MSKGMNKDEAIFNLKNNWDEMHPKTKKDLIYSLLGHRMKFTEISHEVNRSVEEVKEAWKGIIVEAAPPEPQTNSVLPEDCGSSHTYQGVVAPTCCGGSGCKKCWDIFSTVNNMDTSVVSPKVVEVSPMKTMYAKNFDQILAEYRDWVGWHSWPAGTETGKGPGNPDYLEGLIVSDIHAPFHDEARFDKMIADTSGKVDICILAGDGPDYHNYSKYMKYGQHFSVREEHKAFLLILKKLSAAYPEVIMMPGNHDERTRKKFAQLLPADLYQSLLDFHGPDAFDFAELQTKQFENIVIPAVPTDGFAEYRFVYQCGDIVIGHPELYSRIPNKSVGGFIDWIYKKAIPVGLVKAPVSAAVMGHTHMAGKTWNDYQVIGIENGCMCLTPDYDAGPKLAGAPRPLTRGYTLFRTNKKTGLTATNDINFVEVA